MTHDQLNLLVLIVAAVVIAGVVAVRFSTRTGMPGLVIYIGIGLLVGKSGLGINFTDANLAFNIATVLLAVLLIDGGFSTSWHSVRTIIAPAGLLATVGVLGSVATTATIAWFFGIDLRIAILLAAMVSSTDAAATFSILGKLPIKTGTKSTLEAESGFNDPLAIIIVLTVASPAWHTASPWLLAASALYQLFMGALIGLAIGSLGEVILRKASLPSSGLYPIATLAIALLGFAGAGLAGGSGLLCSYVIGLWLGNRPLPHRKTTAGFSESIGNLSEIILFVMLGLLADPRELPSAVLPALMLGIVLTFIARPLSVLICLSPFRVGIREQAFISWAGLRGAIPIVLATIPLTLRLSGALHMFHVIFLLVVFFTLVQAPLLPLVAHWMQVIVPLSPSQVNFESSPLEGVKAFMVQFQIPVGSKLVGLHPDELRLPKDIVFTMAVRNQEVLVADSNLRLRQGDKLLFAVAENLIGQAQTHLSTLSRYGLLGRWLRTTPK